MLFNKKQHQWYQSVLLMLFCFLMPIHQRLATGVILLLAINWLLSGDFLQKFKCFSRPLALLFASFFLIHVFGLLYTSHLADAYLQLETKLSLIIFPLLLLSTPAQDTEEVKRTFYAFILGCLIGSMICFAKAGIIYADTGINKFYYENLSGQLGFHPSYYACYFIFALFSFVFFISNDWHQLKNFPKILAILLSGYFLIFILVLSARMEILASFILFPIAFLVFMVRRKQLLKGLVIMSIGILTISAIAWTLPSTKMRIQVALNGLFNSDQSKTDPDIRLQIWGSSLELIQEKLIFGQGTAAAFPKMMEIYKTKNYTLAYEKGLNIHNQYLETAAALGLLGLLLLLGNLLIPFGLAWKREHFLYLFFIGLFALAMLTESMLQRQQGIIFYACFNSLLASCLLREKRIEEA